MQFQSTLAVSALLLLSGCADEPSDQLPSSMQPIAGGQALPVAGTSAPGGSGGSAGATAGRAGTNNSTGSGGTGTATAGRQSPNPTTMPPTSMAGMSGAGGSAETAGAGGSAGLGGMAGSSQPMAAGGFPKTDEVTVKAKGPYAVMTYTEGLDEPAYSSSMMYYPEGASPPFAAVAFTPGFTATKENYTFLGDMLASHGIVALLTTPTTTGDLPQQRGEDLVAAVAKIRNENMRAGSPLMGKIATDRICVTGHSMGGGGSLFAANELGDMIRCVMPLQPWQPGGSFAQIKAPTMFIGAQSDAIASVSGNAAPHYASIPESTEKFLVVLEGDHYLSTNRTSTDQTAPEEATPSYDIQSAYMIPFYKLFLEDDERYRPYLYGDMRSMMSVTRFEASKM